MSGRQLAERVGVNVARIAEMEKAEAHGNITLRSIRRAAEAMDCELVYALVPRTTLKAALRSQAEKAARRKLRPVAHTMRLEEQGLPPQEEAKQLAEMAEELSRNPPRWLWDAE